MFILEDLLFLDGYQGFFCLRPDSTLRAQMAASFCVQASTDVTFLVKIWPALLPISDFVLCQILGKTSKDCHPSPSNQEWPLHGLLILPLMLPHVCWSLHEFLTFLGPLASAEVDVLFRSGSQIIWDAATERHGISQWFRPALTWELSYLPFPASHQVASASGDRSLQSSETVYL